MAGIPKDDKKTAAKPPEGVSRRGFTVGAGAGVAGLLVGGGIGYVVPRKRVVLPEPATWIGRNLAACSGCRLCQVACSQIKEQKVQPGITRITVHQYYPGIEFPVACYQCGPEAKCIEACPTAALSVDTSKKNNTIAVDVALCLRTAKNGDCTLCLDKCPGAAVSFHPTNRAPLICDLCGGDPECVKVCPDKTITLQGVKMATVPPAQIAAALAEAYKLPPPPPKPPARAAITTAEADDESALV